MSKMSQSQDDEQNRPSSTLQQSQTQRPSFIRRLSSLFNRQYSPTSRPVSAPVQPISPISIRYRHLLARTPTPPPTPIIPRVSSPSVEIPKTAEEYYSFPSYDRRSSFCGLFTSQSDAARESSWKQEVLSRRAQDRARSAAASRTSQIHRTDRRSSLPEARKNILLETQSPRSPHSGIQSIHDTSHSPQTRPRPSTNPSPSSSNHATLKRHTFLGSPYVPKRDLQTHLLAIASGSQNIYTGRIPEHQPDRPHLPAPHSHHHRLHLQSRSQNASRADPSLSLNQNGLIWADTVYYPYSGASRFSGPALPTRPRTVPSANIPRVVNIAIDHSSVVGDERWVELALNHLRGGSSSSSKGTDTRGGQSEGDAVLGTGRLSGMRHDDRVVETIAARGRVAYDEQGRPLSALLEVGGDFTGSCGSERGRNGDEVERSDFEPARGPREV